jgi:hypothetical protein
VSLALLEYFILIFVLEKATRHAEDCVVTKDIESGGKFCVRLVVSGANCRSPPLKQKEIHTPKHLKPAINCITLAVDDLKKSLAFYRNGLGLAAQI